MSYPDIPLTQFTNIDTAKAYEIALSPDERAVIDGTMTGPDTGCGLLLHDLLKEAPVWHVKHTLQPAPEPLHWETECDSENHRVYYLSAWTYLGPDVAGAQSGWFQVAMQFNKWHDHVGGQVTFTCSGSPHGATAIAIKVQVAGPR
ncbi:MAG: hypothetical protein ABSG79_08715 [Bryobacteraceae bacterium]|jgi:hypothetical protein